MTRSQSLETRAKRRNADTERRNKQKREQNPLFESAGILDQVVTLESPAWDANRIAYDDIERGMRLYEQRLVSQQRQQAYQGELMNLLAFLIRWENVEEVVADYDQRWPQGHPMQQHEYRAGHFLKYISRYINIHPLALFDMLNDPDYVKWWNTPNPPESF